MGTGIRELAAALGLPFEGDGDHVVDRPTRPGDATADDLAVAMSPDYADAVGASAARAAILWDGADWEAFGLRAAIFTGRPRYAMAGVTQAFDHPYHLPPGVHPSAIVDPGAELGDDVAIGPFAIVGPGARIGAGARIHAHVTIGEDVVLGDGALLHDGCRILRRVRIGDRFIAHANAVVGGDGFSFVTPEAGAVDEVKTSGTLTTQHARQSYTRIHSLGAVRIGDDVELGCNSTIDRGTLSDTEIGDGTKIDNLVMVGHNVRVGRSCLLCSQVGIAGSATISDNVVLGGQVGVADHVTVGENVVAAGKSGISSNVPPNRVIMGNPAIRMDANVESYKQYRRLPRLAAKLESLQKLVSKLAANS